MAAIKTEWITLKVADGTAMRVYVARPEDSNPYPGLLVYHEAFGVNAHIRDVTERFAREGYLALAPDLFHRTAPGFEGTYDQFDLAKPHVIALTHRDLEADVRSAYEWLRAQPGNQGRQIACVGFCMGGRVAVLTNVVLPVSAAISFYGGGIAPNPFSPGLLDRAGDLHAPQMLLWGGLDKHLGPEVTRAVTEAIRAAGKPFVNVEFSDADHGFFCDARSSYNPNAARQAWALALAFLSVYALVK
ncbi:MAG: dienelactone hydrolase family protein [Terriglobia bacterium]|jgi:carboxymethylenebutenolidase